MSAVGDEPSGAERMLRLSIAQARRDRARLAQAQADIAALQSKVTMLERSLSRRAGGPARRAIRLLHRLLKRQEGALETPGDRGSSRRGLALVIDHHWPQPDRDSGSIDIVTMVEALEALGFEAILAAARQHEGDQPARDRLAAQGVRCLRPEDAASVEAFIQKRGPAIDLCVMCRVFCGGAFLETLQRHARQARLVFNTIDLNFLRESRKAELLQDETLLADVQRLRDREEHVARCSDAIFVVSEAERVLLAESLPESLIVQMPLARNVVSPVNGFGERSGIGFIGGFAHAPNVDAVRYFIDDIWPDVQSALPGCVFSIVGADAPESLAAGADQVRVLGPVDDVSPWFESLRLTVAPLRYGAGAKGKVASSLAHGVPCVITSVAAEGMGLVDGAGVRVCDTPAAFAAAVVSVYTDAAAWHEMSKAGLSFAAESLSLTAWHDRLGRVIAQIGL